MRKVLLALATALTLAGSPPKFNSYRLITEVGSHKYDSDYPYSTPANGKGHMDDFARLMNVAKRQGVEVVVGSNLDDLGFWGLFTEKPRMIYLNPTLSNQGAVEVLVHELSHVLTPMLGKPDDDIVAQGVAYVVCGSLGIDASEGTMYYYFWLMKDFEKAQAGVMRHAKEIDSVSKFILEDMKKKD